MKHKLLNVGIVSILLISGIGCSNAIKPLEQSKETAQKPEQHTELTAAKDFDPNQISEQVNKVLEQDFPGKWSIDGTTLKKGNYTENDSFKIADELAKNFAGSMVSIYAGEERISNTVQGYNGRYLSYQIPAQVAETLKTGKPVFEEAKLNNTKYHKVYLPIKAESNVIGVIGISMKIK